MKNYIKTIASASLAVFIAGCATIFSGTSQTVHVKVVESRSQALLSGAVCSVSDSSGAMYTLTTNPSAITVSKGHGAVVINCHKDGFRQLNMAVGDSFNAVTIVNVLFWPGFIVDAVSGAYKKYPSHYIVNMEHVGKKK